MLRLLGGYLPFTLLKRRIHWSETQPSESACNDRRLDPIHGQSQ